MQPHQQSDEPPREIDEHAALQMREIEAALREADAGDFAEDGEVATVVARWLPRPRTVRITRGTRP
jgi:hypothetical protein